MGAKAQGYDDLAGRVLKRLDLLQVAQDKPRTTWRLRRVSFASLLLTAGGIGGILLALPSMENPHRILLILGVFCCDFGLSLPYDRSRVRLDALMRLLEDKGLLSVHDVPERHSEPVKADAADGPSACR
jgi:hypothetical protein